jgi:hypothetical protein
MFNSFIENYKQNIYTYTLYILIISYFISNQMILEDELIINCLLVITFIFLSQLIKNIFITTLILKKQAIKLEIKKLFYDFKIFLSYYLKINLYYSLLVNKYYYIYLLNKFTKILFFSYYKYSLFNFIYNYIILIYVNFTNSYLFLINKID